MRTLANRPIHLAAARIIRGLLIAIGIDSILLVRLLALALALALALFNPVNARDLAQSLPCARRPRRPRP